MLKIHNKSDMLDKTSIKLFYRPENLIIEVWFRDKNYERGETKCLKMYWISF